MRTTSALLALNVAVWGALVYAWSADATLPPRVETAPTPAPERCRSPEKYGGGLIAVAYETERKPGPRGYGAPLHGDIFLNGHCYHFVTGGRGRGSIPFGRYQIDGAVSRPYLNPNPGHTAYPLSNAYDALAKDTRDSLFVHPGRITKGCIGITAEWEQFELDMEAVRPRTLTLVASGARFDV